MPYFQAQEYLKIATEVHFLDRESFQVSDSLHIENGLRISVLHNTLESV